MISFSSLTDSSGADLNSSNFNWFSASLSSGVASPLSDTTASPDSFQNVFAQASSPAPIQPTATRSVDYAQPNTASPTSFPQPSTVSSGSTSSPLPTDRSAGTASASTQNPDQSNHKSSTRGAPQQKPLHLGSTSIPATTPNQSAHTTQNQGAAPDHAALGHAAPVPAAPDQTRDAPSSSTDGKNTASSSAAPQNAPLVSAANALGGLKNLSGAAFALHITLGPNQAAPNQAAPNRAHAAQSAAAQANAGQSGDNQQAQNQTGQNQDGQNRAASGVDPAAANTPIPATMADPQAILQTSNLAALPALSTWTASAPAAPPPAQSSPSTTLASVVTGEIASEDPAGSPQTVRSVQLQLTGAGEGRVDLHLVEHAGGLSVSVRASDSTLTKGLQDNLPELAARLAEDKYQTHTFLPAANEAGGSSSSSSGQSSGHAPEDQSSGRSFSQGGDGRQTGGQSGGQSESGQPSDSGAAWRRQMAALGALSSSVSHSLSSAQPFGSQPTTQSTNS